MSFREFLKTQVKRFGGRLSSAAGTPPATAPRKEQEYSIGIYIGESALTFRPSDNFNNPILTRQDVSDVRAAIVADPFMINVDDIWYLFFEVLNAQTGKGEIGLATSSDAVKWTYQQIVLAEPFHLSYPYVFEFGGDYYMIPESYQAGSIRLYKAELFPTRWKHIKTLLTGPYYVDTSIFHYDNKWWLFTETNPAMKHDTLRLYYADNLTGPWREHPKSPIIEGNGHVARPAGRVLVLKDRINRYTQDCDPIYGTSVRAFEVTELTATSYCERRVNGKPMLLASGSGWNASGMHHIDPHPLEDGRWIACVDGWDWVWLD
jgi:hypothetical protein